MYKIFHTIKFEKELAKQLSKEEQQEVWRFEVMQISLNPYVGDPLSYRFFREKKVGGKRIYFLIYDSLMAVLMVGISNKKTQHETIIEIKAKLDDYYVVVKDAIKEHA